MNNLISNSKKLKVACLVMLSILPQLANAEIRSVNNYFGIENAAKNLNSVECLKGIHQVNPVSFVNVNWLIRSKGGVEIALKLRNGAQYNTKTDIFIQDTTPVLSRLISNPFREAAVRKSGEMELARILQVVEGIEKSVGRCADFSELIEDYKPILN